MVVVAICFQIMITENIDKVVFGYAPFFYIIEEVDNEIKNWSVTKTPNYEVNFHPNLLGGAYVFKLIRIYS